MLLIGILGGLAICWLLITFFKWCDEIKRAGEYETSFIKKISAKKRAIFGSNYGKDFFGSLVITVLGMAVIGVTGLVMFLFGSLFLSCYIHLSSMFKPKNLRI